jgi:Tfp pilus assembly protein PilV
MNLRPCARRISRRGLSLIEVVTSTLLVALVLLGAMDMLGAVTRGRVSTSEQIRGDMLAQHLMTEILSKAYVDSSSSPLFGPESGEAIGSRYYFDDVDDYHLWTSAPPRYRDGTAMPNTSGWEHSVAVDYVTIANPSLPTLVDTGIKRITVTIERNNRTVARLVALRTDKY